MPAPKTEVIYCTLWKPDGPLRGKVVMEHADGSVDIDLDLPGDKKMHITRIPIVDPTRARPGTCYVD